MHSVSGGGELLICDPTRYPSRHPTARRNDGLERAPISGDELRVNVQQEFWRLLKDEWLPAYCNDPDRQYDVAGFRPDAKQATDIDARDFMRAIGKMPGFPGILIVISCGVARKISTPEGTQAVDRLKMLLLVADMAFKPPDFDFPPELTNLPDAVECKVWIECASLVDRRHAYLCQEPAADQKEQTHPDENCAGPEPADEILDAREFHLTRAR